MAQPQRKFVVMAYRLSYRYFVGTTAIFTLAAASSVVALAGDNVLTLEQRGLRNTLTSDQSQASGSKVGGLAVSGQGPSLLLTLGDVALQNNTDALGSNTANLTFSSGSSGKIFLSQENAGPGANSATVNVNGGGAAALAQNGTGNSATLTVAGAVAGGRLISVGLPVDGAIVQTGDSNTATLTTTTTNQGAIVQQGELNTAAVDLSLATRGTSVVYRQLGDGLQTNGASVQVLSNTQPAGVIVITQQAGVGGPTTNAGATIISTQR